MIRHLLSLFPSRRRAEAARRSAALREVSAARLRAMQHTCGAADRERATRYMVPLYPPADRPALADALKPGDIKKLPELIARLHDIAEEEAEQCNDSTAGPCSQAAAVLEMVLDAARAALDGAQALPSGDPAAALAAVRAVIGPDGFRSDDDAQAYEDYCDD